MSRLIHAVFAAFLLAPVAAADPAAAEVLRASGLAGGLAVHLGVGDGALDCALTNAGRILVHGLALDDASRDAARATIVAKGLYGLASVERWDDLKVLPYADHLVNLLVADLDALGVKAPAQAELMRVIAPKGVLYANQGGRWTATVKPRPAEIDDWTHLDHDAEGNGVSHDKLVRQPTLLQWTSGVQVIKLGGNAAKFVNLTGMRIADGRVFFDWTDAGARGGGSNLAARDAWSGVPLWTIARAGEAARKRWQLVAFGDRVYTALTSGGPLVALDAATGKSALAFDAAGPADATGENNQVRVTGDLVVTNVRDTLFALDARSGAVKWKHSEADSTLLFPCASAAAGKAFVLVAAGGAKTGSRWPWAQAKAVLCLDLATGKEVWRNTAVEGKPIGQLIHHDGSLALFCGSAIGGRSEGGWVGSIAVADGKLRGQGTFKVAWNDSMYNAVVRDGAIWYAGHTHIYRADLATVEITSAMGLGYNQRCNRFCATDDLFICGYVTWLDKAFNGTLQSVARAGCALGATPANGMVYFTPSACGCFTQLRGYQAFSPEPLRPPLPDARRLEKGGKPAAVTVGKPVQPAGPVAEDWTRQEHAPALEIAAVDAGALKLVAVCHEHRVEARDAGGAVKWAFIADGRISQAPLVHNGRAYIGSHDGWVYALNLADGALAWRYLVAPYQRKLCAYGQLESSWPVYGVVLHQGKVCASAGLHPELGGGVYVAGLDPTTGAAGFRLCLSKSPAKVTTISGKTTAAIVPHSFLNGVPESQGDQLVIGTFAFDPKTPDAELQKRLETPVKKK